MAKEVLLIDDSTHDRILTSHFFSNINIDIDAIDDMQAIQKGKDFFEAYKTIIIDWNLARISGLELAKMIRHVVPNAQIILTSSLLTNSMKQEAIRNNFHYLCEKDFKFEYVNYCAHIMEHRHFMSFDA